MSQLRYREMDITTASPETLVVRLYEGAIRNARSALAHQQAGRVAERGRAISRAVAIVSELSSALDMERGGEIARNLSGLYAFVNEQLVQANLEGRGDRIEDALRILDILAEAWVEVARLAGSRRAEAS